MSASVTHCALNLHLLALIRSSFCLHPAVFFCHREPVKSEGPLPLHLIEPLKRSLTDDQFVADTGNIVFYQKPQELQAEPARH